MRSSLPRPSTATLLFPTLAALVACAPAIPGAPGPVAAQGAAVRGQADSIEVRLVDRQGRAVGTAHLTQESDGVRIRAGITRMAAGPHGFHIHARGSCEGPAFESAGPHYHPGAGRHGFLHPEGPHAGDLPVLEVGAAGAVTEYDFTTARVRLGAASLLDGDGASLILHAGPDDYLTDPGGGSGDRVACGVISPGR